MEAIRKYVVMAMLTVGTLFVSTPCADATAAGDAALLAQQLAQFIQDLGFDTAKWKDVEKRLKEVREIARTISKGTQAYSAVNNIFKASGQIIRTGKTLENYRQYLMTFGDNFKIERAYYIYKRFMRQSGNVLDEVQKTISSFDKLTDIKPLELLQAVDDATSSVAAVVSDLGEDSKSETVDLCFNAAMDEVASQNQKFYGLQII